MRSGDWSAVISLHFLFPGLCAANNKFAFTQPSHRTCSQFYVFLPFSGKTSVCQLGHTDISSFFTRLASCVNFFDLHCDCIIATCDRRPNSLNHPCHFSILAHMLGQDLLSIAAAVFLSRIAHLAAASSLQSRTKTIKSNVPLIFYV